MNHLYCYKMTWDTEFAPNPYGGILTLATCKPTIRRCAKVGDWISGWAANTVHDKDGLIYTNQGSRKLIYLAKISKIIPMDEYWNTFPKKRPMVADDTIIRKEKGCSRRAATVKEYSDSGDNIYESRVSNPDYRNENHWIQHENRNHGSEDILHDLSGRNVLVCHDFYYFGIGNSVTIADDVFHVNIPRCKKLPLQDSEAVNLINHICDSYHVGIIKNPLL